MKLHVSEEIGLLAMSDKIVEVLLRLPGAGDRIHAIY